MAGHTKPSELRLLVAKLVDKPMMESPIVERPVMDLPDQEADITASADGEELAPDGSLSLKS